MLPFMSQSLIRRSELCEALSRAIASPGLESIRKYLSQAARVLEAESRALRGFKAMPFHRSIFFAEVGIEAGQGPATCAFDAFFISRSPSSARRGCFTRSPSPFLMLPAPAFPPLFPAGPASLIRRQRKKNCFTTTYWILPAPTRSLPRRLRLVSIWRPIHRRSGARARLPSGSGSHPAWASAQWRLRSALASARR